MGDNSHPWQQDSLGEAHELMEGWAVTGAWQTTPEGVLALTGGWEALCLSRGGAISGHS